MIKVLKNNYLFLVLFLLIILKEPFYSLIHIKNQVYTPTRCHILESDYNKLLEFSEINLIYESDYINTYVIYKDIYNYTNEITTQLYMIILYSGLLIKHQNLVVLLNYLQVKIVKYQSK